MAIHLKIALATSLLLLIVMEECKPILAKKGDRLKQRTKVLENSMADLKVKIKVLEACQSCSVINDLNDTINELRKKIDNKTKHAVCGDPGVPAHGSKTGNNYTTGSMITLACDTGYHLEGPANLLCLENRTWNNALPKCHRLCNKPAPPKNGYLIGSEFWEGKSVTYKCNEGYELQGPTVRVCNGMGEWTGEEPTCKPKEESPTAGLEESEILKKNADYLKALGVFLKPVVQSNSQWKLCWRASLDGWAATTFHSRCDYKGPTVTIIRVGQYIFGGYTSKSWTSTGCGYADDSPAFLFSLSNNPVWKQVGWKQAGWKFEQTGHQTPLGTHSIYRCPTYGPTFGEGYDIQIADQASSNTNSLSLLGHTYGYQHNTFFGDPFTYKFQPDEVEVFYETT